MRILQLGKYYFEDVNGGIEKLVFDIFNNTECDILCSNTKFHNEEIKVGNKKIYKTATFGSFLSMSITPQIIFKLFRIKNNYDIIHIHHPDPISTLSLFFSRFKGKVIVHWHSDIIVQKFALFFFMPLQKWMLNRADKIVGTSMKYLQESHHLKTFNNKFIAIPIGSKKIPITSASPNILEKLKSKKIILSIGRLVEYKGFEYLIKSAIYLPDEYIILIGGIGKLEKKLKNIIQQNNLQNKVMLLGKISNAELGIYYNTCKLFVLPSIYKTEAYGVVQVEAMSFGKPIIATNIRGSGTNWVNQHQITGLNIEPRNPKQIAKAIIQICTNDTLYKTYSYNALNRFNTLFDLSITIRQIINLYKSLSKNNL